MSRGLIKGYRAVVSEKEDAAIIDTNAIIARKLEALQGTGASGEFQEWGDSFGEPVELEGVDALFGEAGAVDEDGMPLEDGNDGAFHSNIIKAAPPQPVYEGPSPEELIASAQEEIAAMKAAAQQEIEELREQIEKAAYDEGKMSGYEDGKAQAIQEVEAMKQQLLLEQQELEAQYQQMLKEVEPSFIEMLTPIYEHVIGASLAEDEEAIRMLVGNAMAGIEGARSFLIHVSGDDFQAVSEGKMQLAQRTGLEDVRVEVVSDMTMSQGQCTIETENGIYDCSLGTQLSQLRKQLRILAYGMEH